LPLGLGLRWQADSPVSIIDPETREVNLFTADDLAFDAEIVSPKDVMEVDSFRYQPRSQVVS
jgi:hypothetical protein